MSRPLGSKNKPKNIEVINNIETKAVPPSFGLLDAMVLAPKTIVNSPLELLKLNKGFVGVCNSKNATSIASTSLRLFAIKDSNDQKIVFPHKSLHKIEQEAIKLNSKSLIVKQAQNIVEITEHPVYEVLNTVNDDLNFYDLMELTSAYLGITGNAYWEIVRGKRNLPEKINVLPAEYTSVLLNETMNISGYRLFNGIFKREFKKKDVIHFKNITPGMFWRIYNNTLVTGLYGMGDLEYVLDEVYLYNSINDYLRALTENNAIPSGVIKYKSGRLEKNTMIDVQKDWDRMMRTWKKAGKVKVMDQDFDFQAISMPPKDLEFNEGRKWLRGVIANAFGVPEDLLTTENSNRSSSNVAISNYFRFTIKPKLKRIEERLNSHLMSLYDDNLFFAFDECIPANEELKQKREVSDLSLGVLTINEVRDKRGLSNVEWGNLPYIPAKETIRENIGPDSTGNNPSTLREDQRLQDRTDQEKEDERNPQEERDNN